MEKEEFNLKIKKEGLYQDLINNIQKAHNDGVNPIGIIQKFIELSTKADKEFIERFKEKLKGCDEFFNVNDYEKTQSTDKFMGIVTLFIKDLGGDFK